MKKLRGVSGKHFLSNYHATYKEATGCLYKHFLPNYRVSMYISGRDTYFCNFYPAPKVDEIYALG